MFSCQLSKLNQLKPASWNFEMGQAIIKKKKAESYNDV